MSVSNAGLDVAIVHAARILPLHKIDERVREICLDLIYDRRTETYDPLQSLIAEFEGVEEHARPPSRTGSGWAC